MFTMVGIVNRTKLVYGYCVLVETYLSVLGPDEGDGNDEAYSWTQE